MVEQDFQQTADFVHLSHMLALRSSGVRLSELTWSAEQREVAREERHAVRQQRIADPLMRAADALEATTVGPHDARVEFVFVALGLNPEDPADWGILVRCFADLQFKHSRPSGKRRGRKQKWNWNNYEQILFEVADLKRKHPDRSSSWIFDRIAKIRSKNDPSGIAVTAEGIKKLHQRAKDPNFNTLLISYCRIGVEDALKQGLSLDWRVFLPAVIQILETRAPDDSGTK